MHREVKIERTVTLIFKREDIEAALKDQEAPFDNVTTFEWLAEDDPRGMVQMTAVYQEEGE